MPAHAIGVLVHHYEFENNGNDSVGANNGTVGGSVSFATGNTGLGMVNTAGGQPAYTINATAFNPGSGDFSFDFWVKRDRADSGNADGIFDALASTGVGFQANFRTGTDEDKFGVRIDGNGNANFDLLVDPTTLTDTTSWHHFAVTVDRTNSEGKLYRDGSPVLTEPLTIAGSVIPNQTMWIGTINGAANNGIDGTLDDLRFYTGVLTESQVQGLAGIPEPSAFSLAGLAGLALVLRRRRRR